MGVVSNELTMRRRKPDQVRGTFFYDVCFLELNKVGWQPHKIVEHNLLDLSLEKCKDTIARVDLADITMEEFQEKFEKPGIPVILTGATRNWDATEKWVPQVNIWFCFYVFV